MYPATITSPYMRYTKCNELTLDQLVMGLAGVKGSWQRQTRYFGHDRGDTYSVLLVDNRGMGDSDKPSARYSTSAMAADMIEVVNHVGWTSLRQIHLVGISLGGMIAQEVACAIPERLASLSLLCTTAEIQNNKPLTRTIFERAGMLVPKSEERGIADTSKQIFMHDWLVAPDAEHLPSVEETPKCGPAGGDGQYRLFDNNFQRFQAQELAKRRDKGSFTLKGFLLQLIASGWHCKSPEQLREMADKIGREHIMVMHGTGDRMIPVENGRRLVELVQPGMGLIVDGMGHAPVMERAKWFNELLEDWLVKQAGLGEKN